MIKLEPRGERSKRMAYLSPVLAAVLTMLTGVILFTLLGVDPWEALVTILYVPISDTYGIAELCVKATPILLCAIGLSVVFKAQIWNIGAEGQLLIGGLFGSYMALQLIDVESAWVLPTVLVFGALGGLVWAGIAALLKVQFNTNEILTTIMMNYIALNILLWAVHGPLKDPDGYNFPESAMFSDSSLLPLLIEDTRIHFGLALALLAVVAIWVLMSRSFYGFQIKVMGLDASAARLSGFKEKRLAYFALMLSGALAGLAGVSEVTGPIGQLIPNISPGYGYAAIIVAFLGRLHPVGILLASLLMALLYMGGEMAQISLGLPLALTGLFQGMLLFYLLACDVLISFRVRWISRQPTTAPIQPTTNTQG
ncbi:MULTISPECIES: ABC transporter permease [unclassified Oceanobacter]|jgi:simple sugar transport system permease protein|uniref:ABC transporter permease n=1 Tax=unclassified Oceanobacter TaxID=2620260 RepID=UPI0026E273C9|nr:MULTISPECIES: ABC transporter permease [unclassified Oceanobacter]MDO6683092.1 ABC transporter permease [Oceanobacter sp. 5_MG-2023]MDP2505899.1 ABC transporter permease [Oceanobacter sp. 3_MG-2023]MDP2548370.1 ABC transporter permease [Oceanobacter sp. 4_MG-2023]MDP2608377.1 ABC transporter permease [Oceanobacter sp. 1_MG-2023]MDP2611472.1 ABC transporter permease [Oceanobacter sp. 2_MG-2023]